MIPYFFSTIVPLLLPAALFSYPDLLYPLKDTVAAAALVLEEIMELESTWAMSERRKWSKAEKKEQPQHKMVRRRGRRYNLWETALQCRISLQPQDLGLTCCITGESGEKKYARQWSNASESDSLKACAARCFLGWKYLFSQVANHHIHYFWTSVVSDHFVW